MSDFSLGIIGGGNMATSLISGLIRHNFPAEKIFVSEPDANKCQQLNEQYAIHAQSNNSQAAKQKVVILAVKPQVMKSVLLEIKPHLNNSLIISIAAGITIEAISEVLGRDHAIVRCMPNTPALLGYGMSGLFANEHVSVEQQQWAEKILSSVGKTLWFTQQTHLDMVTAISGSGPAYFFLFMEALIAAGQQLGLSHQAAVTLVKQTALGAAMMINQTPDEISTLRQNVTSPGGTTEAALNIFQQSLPDLVMQSVLAAFNRAQELGQ